MISRKWSLDTEAVVQHFFNCRPASVLMAMIGKVCFMGVVRVVFRKETRYSGAWVFATFNVEFYR